MRDPNNATVLAPVARRLAWAVATFVFAGAVFVATASPAVANNCAIPPDLLRQSETSFVATVTDAEFRGGDVVYQLADVQGNEPQPPDLVVVALPNNGVSGASFRVGQSYWFAPDSVSGSEARVEVCKFGLSGERPPYPSIFVPSNDHELELTIDPAAPFANVDALFTATIASATLLDSTPAEPGAAETAVAEYTVIDVSTFAGDVPDSLRIRTLVADGVFTVGERAWFAPSVIADDDGTPVLELSEPEFGTRNSLSAMYEGFGIDPSADEASTTTQPELSAGPIDLTVNTTTEVVGEPGLALAAPLGILALVAIGAVLFWRQRNRWEK